MKAGMEHQLIGGKRDSPGYMLVRSFDYNFAPLKLASGEVKAGKRGRGLYLIMYAYL